MTSPILEIDGITSGYGAGMVVRNVSLSLHPGEIYAVMGKNGMGKSTLLKTLMGFVRPTSGTVMLDGADVTHLAPQHMAGRAVAYAPQEFTLFQDLTVEENLRLAVPQDRLFRDRLPMLEAVFPRIPDRLRQRAGTLSGGEQKMLLMSRAMLAKPRVMLIDEISEGLQPTMIERMAEVLRKSRDQDGTAVLLVEQHLAFALSVADRYGILKLGEIVEEGIAGDPGMAEKLAEHLKV
ncbi:MAG: ABC transporter ATP-binding protein [Roseovarius sp.]|jgi:ABC-type branched-subunit amino acid transport system ATPase component|nr:ABC transporter ATP-binding protein [Roseovarius sp.]